MPIYPQGLCGRVDSTQDLAFVSVSKCAETIALDINAIQPIFGLVEYVKRFSIRLEMSAVISNVGDKAYDLSQFRSRNANLKTTAAT